MTDTWWIVRVLTSGWPMRQVPDACWQSKQFALQPSRPHTVNKGWATSGHFDETDPRRERKADITWPNAAPNVVLLLGEAHPLPARLRDPITPAPSAVTNTQSSLLTSSDKAALHDWLRKRDVTASVVGLAAERSRATSDCCEWTYPTPDVSASTGAG